MRLTLWILGLTGMIAWQTGCKAPQPEPAQTQPPVPREPAIDPMLSVNTLKPAPPNFLAARLASPDYAIPAYAKFLAGVRVCLDPGHGGDAEKRAYKRGPTGVREAEVDLRLAQYLRELLTRAGADVRLTREDDRDIALSDRAAIANDWPADLFISLHHNANEQDACINRTTVWYHAGVDYRPSSLDLARYLCYALYDGLGLTQFVDVPLRSDQLMFAGGFAVLRETNMTGALTESSYFTDPCEEQRLRDPEYNLREAYALFLGLAKYAAAGLPRAHLIEPPDGTLVLAHSDAADPPDSPAASQPTAPPTEPDLAQSDNAPLPSAPYVVFELDDGLRCRRDRGFERQMILSDTISVHLDGQPVPHAFTNDDYHLRVDLPADLTVGEHEVRVDFQNMNKNSVLNPVFQLTVAR